MDDDVRVPDVPEHVVAYRSWTLDDSGLVGFHGQVWPVDGPMEAGCSKGCEVVPCEDGAHARQDDDGYWPLTGTRHNCGIYGKHEPDAWHEGGRTDYIRGRVLMWGRMFEYDEGWRAQHARIDAVFDDGWGPVLRRQMEVWAGLYGFAIEDPPLDEPGVLAERNRARVAEERGAMETLRRGAEALRAQRERDRTLDQVRDAADKAGVVLPSKFDRQRSWPHYVIKGDGTIVQPSRSENTFTWTHSFNSSYAQGGDAVTSWDARTGSDLTIGSWHDGSDIQADIDKAIEAGLPKPKPCPCGALGRVDWRTNPSTCGECGGSGVRWVRD